MTPMKEARQLLGLTQKALAEKVGCTQVHISNVENGADQASPALAKKLAKELGITEEQILYPERFTK